jgi:hypothetical protein
MSIVVDVQFLNEISYRFEKFARKGNYLFNCRCPFCGDSQRSTIKARGYFFPAKDHLNFKCHNCGKSTTFANVLKTLDGATYRRYIKERFTDTSKPQRSERKEPTFVKSEKRKEMEEAIDVRYPFLEPVSSLPPNHDAVMYLTDRKIPDEYHHLFYYCPKTSFLSALCDKYAGKFNTEEPRVVLPVYNMDKHLVGVIARDITGKSSRRYLALRIDDKSDMMFGLDRVDFSENAIIVEGPIDSLFLHNAVAAGSTSLDKIDHYFEKERVTLVFDNQPRNKDVVKIVQSAVNQGFKVFVWPSHVEQKDINDLIKAGWTQDQVEEMIAERTYTGLSAKAKLFEWRKC